MQLPYTIVITPPTRAELSIAARTWWAWVLGAGLGAMGAALILAHFSKPSLADVPAILQVSSAPAGAAISIDGRIVGRTPAAVTLPQGDHRLSLEHDGYLGIPRTTYLKAGETTVVHEDLWLRSPVVERLRPIFPGASFTNATYLQHGTLALTVELRPGTERQLWLREPDATLRRIGPPEAHGPLAVTLDGGRVAYLAQTKGSTPQTLGLQARLDEVWLTDHDGSPGERRFALPGGSGNERLVDVSWAPDEQHLLIISRQQQSDGGLRSRLILLDTRAGAGESRDLLRFPGDVVPSSLVWSPDGRWTALLVRASQRTILCLVGMEHTTFRYLADLGADHARPFPFTPVAWSPDSRQVLYAAPAQDRSGQGFWPLSSKGSPALFVVDVSDPRGGHALSGAQGQAPIWRSDGQILTLNQPKAGSPSTLRVIAPSGQTADLLTLAVPKGTLAAVRWDATHGQALVALRQTEGFGLNLDQIAGQSEYWLVHFRDEEEAGR